MSFDKYVTVYPKLHYTKYSVHFRSVKSLSLVWFFATPWTSALQASLSITISQTLLKVMFIELVMPSSHFILCRPLLCWLAHRLGLETRKTKPWLGAWNFQLSSSRKGRGARNWVNNGLSPHEEASIKSQLYMSIPNSLIILSAPHLCTLLYLDWITNRDIQFSTMNSDHYITT